VTGAGGISPIDAPPEHRLSEADYARGWYGAITTDIWG
jgi:sulfide dehydrogenase [flavocytochrome c] flavoprotein subunit